VSFKYAKAQPEPARECRLSMVAPAVLVRYVEALRIVRQKVGPCEPFETRRSNLRQQWLYAQGRDWPGTIVTNAETVATSWHGAGIALDSTFVNSVGEPVWDVPVSQWEDFGSIMEEHGLRWGGRWKRPDSPHVQALYVPTTPTDDDGKNILNGTLYNLVIKYGLGTVSYYDDPAHI
jgi:D-alanyl-D-alanine carboxypeptidase-like protein